MKNKSQLVREYSINEAYLKAWGIYRKNWKPIIIILLLFYIPHHILKAYLQIEGITKEKIDGPLYYVGIFLLSSILVGIITMAAMTWIAKQDDENKKITILGVLKKAISKIPAIVATGGIEFIFILALYVLFIVPGIIYMIYWIFSIYAVVACNKIGTGALDYSKKIVKGRWWKVFWFILFYFLLISFIRVILKYWQAIFPDTQFFEIFFDTLLVLFYSVYHFGFIIFFINLDKTKDMTKQERMPVPKKANTKTIEKFQEIKKKNTILIYVLFLIGMGVMFIQFFGALLSRNIENFLLSAFGIAMIIGMILFSSNWRCPSCKALVSSWHLNKTKCCKKCGVRLEDE